VKPIYTKNRVIGLLGGSFNPAHSGHLHITRYALNKMKMDGVWWLVSPANPLKNADELAAYKTRLQSARDMASDSRIHVSDIESRLKTRYSIDTLRELARRFPGTRFVWLMGADNLAQFHRWRKWHKLFMRFPIVVFDRAPHSHKATHSKAYLRNRRFLRKNEGLRPYPGMPSLTFVHMKRDPVSSTHLRKKLGKSAFLRHNESTRSK
jgi:nicotinate-nucleotide adenylyltransferase